MWAYEKEHFSGGVDGGGGIVDNITVCTNHNSPIDRRHDRCWSSHVIYCFSYFQNHKIKTMTFTNKAIKCDTWQQMERLAELARKQGYTASKWFTEECFYDGDVFFEIDNDGVYDCFAIPIYPETTYTTFINSHPDISVEGC